MKTDLYTKTILTIIAICLMWICISMTSSAFADRDVVDDPAWKKPMQLAVVRNVMFSAKVHERIAEIDKNKSHTGHF